MDPSLVLPIVFLFNGATLAIALDGILQAIHVILSTKGSTILVLLLVTNALFFTYCCVNLAQITASMANCTLLTYVANFLGHFTMLSLDYFVMFKCWILCREAATWARCSLSRLYIAWRGIFVT
ncbi:hypothetical protein BC830DRAFT_1146003 [Chytriomyces sp. MP71]|nr:hypothetical protein BC830DRAFT_1146003 [Chytriomyces sp. MP71]